MITLIPLLLSIVVFCSMVIMVCVYFSIRIYLQDIRKELRLIEGVLYREERRKIRRL